VIQSWEKVVGQMVAKNTSQLHIRKRVLFVKVNSAALRNELLFARQKIIQALNREAGGTIIDEIVLN
jgi:predicted nucleic acid-binding Zn ribbon protein